MLSLPTTAVTTAAAARLTHRALRQTFASSSQHYTRLAASRRAFHASSRKMTVHNIESVDAWKTALKQNKIVMLDCFATWCGPCKAIAPLLAKHSNEEQFKDVFFAKIDVDDLPDLAQELGIRAMPTFKIFVDGEQADELVGANPGALLNLLTKAVEPTAAA